MAYKKAAPTETAFKHKINDKTVAAYAAFFKKSGLSFQEKTYKDTSKNLAPLELKDRVVLIARALQLSLAGNSYSKQLKAFRELLKEQKLQGFELWPLSHYIQLYGLEEPTASLEFLKFMTPYFTAEFAVRPYLKKYPNETYQFLLECSEHTNEHVRRWSSEGTRPRLPWGEKLHEAEKNPAQGLKILENLSMDSSDYVRKSVANHLNDIGLHHAALLIKTLKNWKQQVLKSKNKTIAENFEKLSKQALRNLIKKGNSEALELMGVSSKSKIKLESLKSDKRVFIGDALSFSFTIHTDHGTKVVLDYAIHYLKKNGQISRKVFKLKTFIFEGDKALLITKKHSFKLVTTRSYYPGNHGLEILVNGNKMEHLDFKLLSN